MREIKKITEETRETEEKTPYFLVSIIRNIITLSIGYCFSIFI